MRYRVGAAVAVLAALAVALGLARAAERPPVGRLQADFVQADFATYYSIEVRTEQPYTIEWRLDPPPDDPGCANFRQLALKNRAVWLHGDQHGCDHTKTGPAGHGGVVTVVVRLSDRTCTASYRGTESGDSLEPECVMTGASAPTTTASASTPPHGPPCTATVTAGLFEPTQGVWQDDPTFADRPGKQISRVRDGLLHAELPMVQDRPAVLVGVERVAGGPADGRRDRMIFRGVGFGTVTAPVQVRVTRIDAGGSEVVYTSLPVAQQLPIYGPCASTPRPWEIEVVGALGQPPEPFAFPTAGPYTLRAELLDEDGTPLGLRAEVQGEVVATRLPRLVFVPVLVTGAGNTSAVAGATATMAANAAAFLPDWLPLPAAPVATTVAPQWDLRPLVAARASGLGDSLHRLVGLQTSAPDLVAAVLGQALAQSALVGGATRVVAVTNDAAFDEMGSSSAQAFAQTTKVVVVRAGSDSLTVAHELVHTLPQLLWSSDEMSAECGIDYHHGQLRVASGLRILRVGAPGRRERYEKRSSLMSSGDEGWIDQCTYRHALAALRGRVDPPTTLVQGFVARRGGRAAAVLRPGYELAGTRDLARGTGGDWAIVVRRGGRGVRYPFEPAWTQDVHGRVLRRSVLPFAYRIPRVAPGSTIEVAGPAGASARVRVSAHTPRVRIVRAQRSGRELLVAWRVGDADGGDLVSTVLVSGDGGRTWTAAAPETAATSLRIPLPAGERLAVRVVTSDGARSAAATRAVS